MTLGNLSCWVLFTCSMTFMNTVGFSPFGLKYNVREKNERKQVDCVNCIKLIVDHNHQKYVQYVSCSKFGNSTINGWETLMIQ